MNENKEKSERRREKDIKNRKIIWIVIIFIVILLALMKLFEVNFSSIKDRFTDENGKFTLSSEVESNNYPFDIDSSTNVVIETVGSNLAILTPSSFTVIKPSNADITYSATHGYANPIMETAGSFSLIYDQGTNYFRLDSSGENIYENKADSSIISATVSKSGNVAYSTTSKEKVNDIYVVTKALKNKLKYSISSGYITSITINSSGNEVAFVATNSENAKIKSTIYIMNINDSEPKKTFTIDDNVISLKYNGDNIYVLGQDFLSVIKNSKNLTKVIEPTKMNTVCFDYNSSGALVLIYNSYNNSTENQLALISSTGKIKTNIKVEGTVKDVSASSSVVSVLIGSKIISYSLSNGEKKETISCDDSSISITRLSSYIFYQHKSLIDRKEAKN